MKTCVSCVYGISRCPHWRWTIQTLKIERISMAHRAVSLLWGRETCCAFPRNVLCPLRGRSQSIGGYELSKSRVRRKPPSSSAHKDPRGRASPAPVPWVNPSTSQAYLTSSGCSKKILLEISRGLIRKSQKIRCKYCGLYDSSCLIFNLLVQDSHWIFSGRSSGWKWGLTTLVVT